MSSEWSFEPNLEEQGLFTTLRLINGHPQLLARHLKRLRQSCSQLALPDDWSDPPIEELIRRNGAEKGLWRIKLAITAHCRFLQIAPAQERSFHPLRLGLYPHPIGDPLSQIKRLLSPDRGPMERWAKREGWDDCVGRDRSGHLLEGSKGNLFWHHRGGVYTPDPALPLLSGIALETIAPEADPVRLGIDELPEGANLFLCNVLSGPVPVVQLEERTFPLDLNLCSLLLARLEAAESLDQRKEGLSLTFMG